MATPKLLIVEDCEPVAQLLATSLSERFEEIEIVPTLAAARRRFRLVDPPPFGFVICSLTLPDGPGTEFKEWLDRHEAPRRVPFVLLAGSLPSLRRPQADLVMLPKPFQIAELFGAIDDAQALAERAPVDGTADGILPIGPRLCV